MQPMQADSRSTSTARVEKVVLILSVGVVLLSLVVSGWLGASCLGQLTAGPNPLDSIPTDDALIARFKSNRDAYEASRVRLARLPIESIGPSRMAFRSSDGAWQVYRKRKGQWQLDDGIAPISLPDMLDKFGVSMSDYQAFRRDTDLLDAEYIGRRLYYRDSGDFAVTKYQVGNVASSITKGIVHAAELPYGMRILGSTDAIPSNEGIWFRAIEGDWYVCLAVD